MRRRITSLTCAAVAALMISVGLSACGGEPAARQAVKWMDEVGKSIRGADEVAEAKIAVRKTPTKLSDKARQLAAKLDEDFVSALCDGTGYIVDALEAGETPNFDWTSWSSENFRPVLESDFSEELSEEQIDAVTSKLSQVLTSLEGNIEALKGVADACDFAYSL
jgi:hypothetical protein